MSEKINYYGFRKWLIIAGLALVLFVAILFVDSFIVNYYSRILNQVGYPGTGFSGTFVITGFESLAIFMIFWGLSRQFVLRGIACPGNTLPLKNDSILCDTCWLKPLGYLLLNLTLRDNKRRTGNRLKIKRMLLLNPPIYFGFYVSVILYAFVFYQLVDITSVFLLLVGFHCLLISVSLHHHKPVIIPEFTKDDLLGTEEIAEKISKQILESNKSSDDKNARTHTREPKNKSIALLGPFGSGKTTVVDIVHKNIIDSNGERSDEDHLVCSINGWNISDGQLSVVVLRSLINTVSSVTDTFMFRNIDQDYLQSLGVESKSLVSILRAFLQSEDSSDDHLRKFNGFLENNRIRVTIIIEDVDRNLDSKSVINEVAGLLERLYDLDRINYILTIDSGIGNELIPKVFQNKEYMPSLSTLTLYKNVIKLYKSILDQNTFNDIRPLDRYLETKYFIFPGQDESLIPELMDNPPNFQFTEEYAYPLYRILKYVDSVRIWTRIEKQFIDSWDILHGEVSWCELLFYTILHNRYPTVLSSIIANFERIIDPPSKINFKKLRNFDQDTISYLKGLGIDFGEEDQKVAAEFIGLLFDRDSSKFPQSFKNVRMGRDYLNNMRFNRKITFDQELLKLLKSPEDYEKLYQQLTSENSSFKLLYNLEGMFEKNHFILFLKYAENQGYTIDYENMSGSLRQIIDNELEDKKVT